MPFLLRFLQYFFFKIADHVERHFAEAIIWTLSPVVSEGSVIALELTFVVGADQNK